MAATPSLEHGFTTIDRDVLQGLETALGTARVRGFVVEYLVEADRLLGEVRGAWARCDVAAVYRPAHNLVSNAGNFGALRVAALADAVQQAAR